MKKDFFSRYRESRKTHQYIIPGIFALALSITTVANYHGDLGNLRALSASVIAGVQNGQKYDADLLIERHDHTIDIRIGKDARKVDTLSLTLLGDPSLFTTLTTDDPTISIESREPGMYVVKARLNGIDLHAGDRVTGLVSTLPIEAHIGATDASFTSDGVVYGLSVKGE